MLQKSMTKSKSAGEQRNLNGVIVQARLTGCLTSFIYWTWTCTNFYLCVAFFLLDCLVFTPSCTRWMWMSVCCTGFAKTSIGSCAPIPGNLMFHSFSVPVRRMPAKYQDATLNLSLQAPCVRGLRRAYVHKV
jgi:hypothetical protein